MYIICSGFTIRYSLILTSKKYCLPYYMYIKVLSFKLQAEILDRRVLIIEYIHLFTLKPAKQNCVCTYITVDNQEKESPN